LIFALIFAVFAGCGGMRGLRLVSGGLQFFGGGYTVKLNSGC
jgi:hypothetical protein